MREFIRYFSFFLLIAAIQVYVLDNVYLFSLVHPVVFFYILMVIPRMPKWIFMLLAFGIGIIMDSFYYTPGVNSAACVLIAYIREPALRFLKPNDDGEINNPHIHFLGFTDFLYYCFIMGFFFHIVSSFLAIFSMNEIILTLVRVVVNTMVSAILIFILDILFFYRKEKER